jgi:hypothetical protein
LEEVAVLFVSFDNTAAVAAVVMPAEWMVREDVSYFLQTRMLDSRERAKRVSFSLYHQYVNRYQIKWYYYFSDWCCASRY